MVERTYIVTTAQRGATPHKDFLLALDKYAKKNDSEILILPTNGMFPSSNKQSDEEELHPYLTTNYDIVQGDLPLSKHVGIKDFPVQAQQMDPITSLDRHIGDEQSAIFASTKQRMRVVPNSNTTAPKVLMTTGACTHPHYQDSRRGTIARMDHVYGAITVTIDEETDRYHFRQLRANKKGDFQDLEYKFSAKDRVRKVPVDTLVMGDYHCREINPDVLAATEEIIKVLKPKRLVLHDFFDGYSISHHDEGRFVRKAQKDGGLNLADELYECGRHLAHLRDLSKNMQIYLVKSNHDEVLDRYLQEARFIKEPHNLRKAIELMGPFIDGEDPLKVGIESTYGEIPGVTFLTRDDDFKRFGWQLASHGDLGANGSRGGVASLEKSTSKQIVGHCFSEDTDVLTKRGWLRFGELKDDDVVMTMNKNTGVGEWNKINAFHKYTDFTELISIKSKASDLLVTEGHGLIAEHTNGTLTEFTAKEFSEIKNEYKFFNAVRINKNKRSFTPNTIALIVQIITDGSYSKDMIRWHLKKPRKIKRLKQVLDSLNCTYSENTTKTGTTKINLATKDSRHWKEFLPGKTIPKEFLRLSIDELIEFLEEYAITDGIKYEGRIQLSSSKEQDIDILQAMAALVGRRSAKYQKESGNYCLNITETDTVLMSKKHSKVVSYEGFVWCLSVDNGTLLVRRNGKVVLTQNSHSPQIQRNFFQVGTSTHLRLDYTRGPSSWLNTHAVLYAHGQPSLINVIEGDWR